jgi:hypothetical protein
MTGYGSFNMTSLADQMAMQAADDETRDLLVARDEAWKAWNEANQLYNTVFNAVYDREYAKLKGEHAT